MPLDAGVVVVDTQDLLRVFDAVILGRPAVDRVIALAGDAFDRTPHLRVRVGTPFEAITEAYLSQTRRVRLVVDSLLTGKTIRDRSLPVEQTSTVLIAMQEQGEGELLSFARPGFTRDSYSRTFLARFLPFTKKVTTNLNGERRPCLSCGYCDAVCPARVLPQILHRYVDRDLVDETLARYQIFRCFDCNLCSYVCPSKIPVAALMKKGKAQLAAEGIVAPEAVPERENAHEA
jgi:Na(+)-translocating NADH:ubiquinone oxidoreductase A subunit